jgi:arsenite methyltransferase
VLIALGFLFRHGVRVGSGRVLVLNLHWFGWSTGTACLVEGALMVWYARAGKFIHRDRMLALHPWRGDEQTLDVGTGRGLLLVGAAKCAPRGRAVGIDIWRAEDLTGNTAEATTENLRREGVLHSTELLSMPAQAMTFTNATFDVVVSNLCLHNIDARADRDQACREIVRVLRPGGVALISDFRNTHQYAAAFRAAGCTVRRTGIDLATFPPLRIVIATRP